MKRIKQVACDHARHVLSLQCRLREYVYVVHCDPQWNVTSITAGCNEWATFAVAMNHYHKTEGEEHWTEEYISKQEMPDRARNERRDAKKTLKALQKAWGKLRRKVVDTPAPQAVASA